MPSSRIVITFVCTLSLAATAARAAANTQVDPLTQALSQAERLHPERFAALSALRQQMPALDQTRRGGLAVLTPKLRALGPEALLPMLAALRDRQPVPGWSETAERAWRVGLIEATGMLRDPAALPVLVSVLDTERDETTLTLTAAAIGRLDTPAAATALLTHARVAATPALRLAVLSGSGTCRQPAVAAELARALDAARDTEDVVKLAKALGEVANGWAWQALVAQARSAAEHLSVEQLALAALTRAKAAHRDDARATSALSVAERIINAR